VTDGANVQMGVWFSGKHLVPYYKKVIINITEKLPNLSLTVSNEVDFFS
jgi:hypothetical protein